MIPNRAAHHISIRLAKIWWILTTFWKDFSYQFTFASLCITRVCKKGLIIYNDFFLWPKVKFFKFNKKSPTGFFLIFCMKLQQHQCYWAISGQNSPKVKSRFLKFCKILMLGIFSDFSHEVIMAFYNGKNLNLFQTTFQFWV